MKHSLWAASMLLMLTGCLSSPPDIQTLVERILPDAEFMPALQATQNERVVVLPAESISRAAEHAGATRALTQQIENLLFHSNADVIDRSLAGKLRDEIRLIEASGGSAASALTVADYAILPEISLGQVEKRFSEARSYTNDDGKSVYIPATCSYQTHIQAVAKIYTLPALTLVNKIELDGETYESEETRHSRCPLSATQEAGMLQTAARDAVNDSRAALRNQFSPKGYVLQYLTDGSDHVIAISLGLEQNLKAGYAVNFTQKRKRTHPRTGETIITEVKLKGQGEVLANIESDFAYVEIDEALAKQLRRGDIATIDYTGMCDSPIMRTLLGDTCISMFE